MHFAPNGQLVVKLGDPGLPMEYSVQDVPWIPIEDYNDLSASRKNLKGDIWAYATTLWEIFSRGSQLNVPNPVQFFTSGERPPKPADCAMLPGIHDLMIRGWDVDPERRFSPQKIFSRLLEASKLRSLSNEFVKGLTNNKNFFIVETALSRNYSEPSPVVTNTSITTNGTNGTVMNGTLHSRRSRTTTMSDYYNGSMLSADTQHTYITSPGTTQAYIENCGSSITSNQSHDGGSSQVSLLNGNSSHSNGSSSTIAFYGPDDFDGYYSGIPSVLEFNGTRIIFQGEIGRVSWSCDVSVDLELNKFPLQGNYGHVFRGNMESFEDERPVAIKLFRMIESDAQFRDFQREAKIMKTLEHDNIVKIYGFREEPLLIIMEYMNDGSLLTYLSIHRPDLKVENLLDFASDIAKVGNLNQTCRWQCHERFIHFRACNISNRRKSFTVI